MMAELAMRASDRAAPHLCTGDVLHVSHKVALVAGALMARGVDPSPHLAYALLALGVQMAKETKMPVGVPDEERDGRLMRVFLQLLATEV